MSLNHAGGAVAVGQTTAGFPVSSGLLRSSESLFLDLAAASLVFLALSTAILAADTRFDLAWTKNADDRSYLEARSAYQCIVVAVLLLVLMAVMFARSQMARADAEAALAAQRRKRHRRKPSK